MSVEKKNLLLTDITEQLSYKGRGRSDFKTPTRDREAHARNISLKYETFVRKSLSSKQVAAIQRKGMYAEFASTKGFELAVQSLENRQAGIRLLNVQNDQGIMKATVYIPKGKEKFFRDRITAYSNKNTKSGHPRNADLIDSIENIDIAPLESFWTDRKDKIPKGTPINCEIWLRYDPDKGETREKVEDIFNSACETLNIPTNRDRRIVFPERIVKRITATRKQLLDLLAISDYITEIKRTIEPTSFFTNLKQEEQRAWSEELLSRCKYENTGVSVCLLDAGMNDHHLLIAPAVKSDGLHSINPDWGTEDNVHGHGFDGHGTEMAGLILYNDLQEALDSTDSIVIRHQIESVKILPNHGYNSEDLYGHYTQDAVTIAEISNPDTNRVVCMPVTAEVEYEDPKEAGKPSSWSAALDKITSGSDEEDNPHRLFIVSAGNVRPEKFAEGIEYPERNTLESIQDPGQAWNAITVGGYSNRTDITEKGYEQFSALAHKGQLSPYSTTSLMWGKGWPIKPEVLFDGGNMATDGQIYTNQADLSILTTNYEPNKRLFTTTWATSAATAQAANFAAQLMAEYPEYWPETIRALMIHSAEWTEEMREQFCPPKKDTTKGQRAQLLRTCGYGIPNLNAAIQCADNAVNMIVQGEIQPFTKKNKTINMNEMHIHSFPWPKQLLLDMGQTQVKLKVTLSYFIEPSPGERGWKSRYRYRSSGLGFEINSPDQTLEEFKNKVSKLAQNEDPEEDSSNHSSGIDWYLGANNRRSGSIHSDFIISNAAQLCDTRHIAVYPTSGWWRERPYDGKSENKMRYSLIVSLSTPETNVDLYTEIINQIEDRIPVIISTKNSI